MRIERNDTTFNRVMNGNFSNGLAYWGGADITHIRKAAYVEDARYGLLAFDRPSPGVGHEGGPAEETIPMYLMIAHGGFWHEVQYNDLSVYPSIVTLDQAIARPSGRGEYIVTGSADNPNVYPFGFQPGTVIEERVLFGDMVVLTDNLDVYSGEYRAGELLDSATMKVYTAGDIPEPMLDGADFPGALYKTNPAPSVMVNVRVLGDLTTAARSDGSVGLKAGVDYFVSENPKAVGNIQSYSFDGTFTNMMLASPAQFDQFPDTGGSFDPINKWIIVEAFAGKITRSLPVCLYDLTLAYTLRNGYVLDPADVRLKFFDEFGAYQGLIEQDGDPKVTEIPATEVLHTAERSFRVVSKFKFERLEPFFGKFTIAFDQGTGATHISDVVLLKGDYTDEVSDEDETGLLEGRISVESEIEPRGSIIAYIGGAVCPAGYERVEGIGVEEDHLGREWRLFSPFGTADTWFEDIEVVHLPNGEARTLITLKDDFSRPSGEPSEPWQITGGWVEVDPFRFDETDQPNYDWHLQLRQKFGDPTPVWVDNLQFVKSDVVPGCILELRFTFNKEPIFAIISQYAQGERVLSVEEQRPRQPFYNGILHWLVLRHFAKNEALGDSGVGFYGQFQTNIGSANQIELVGDFERPIREAVASSVETYVWKSGAIAHAQSLEELKDRPIYVEKGVGGYGLLRDAHSHQFKEGDMTIIPDVGNPVDTRKLHVEHSHGWMFGAASIPKVRPVLLCQKK